MNDTRVKYPNRLREIRKAKGLKQTDVSAYLGIVGEDRICKWEQGSMVPHLVNLLKICELLDDIHPKEIYPDLTRIYK